MAAAVVVVLTRMRGQGRPLVAAVRGDARVITVQVELHLLHPAITAAARQWTRLPRLAMVNVTLRCEDTHLGRT